MNIFGAMSVVLLTALAACAENSSNKLQYQSYFPLGTWGEAGANWTPEEYARFHEHWFGRQLFAMQEPSLATMSATTALVHYRVTVLPSFTPPQMVHIRKEPVGSATVTYKSTLGSGGFEPGDLWEHTSQTLSENRLVHLEKTIAKLGLWERRALEMKPVICFDGTTYVLEVARNGYFNAVNIHECEVLPEFRSVLELFDQLVPRPLLDEMTYMRKMAKECQPPLEPDICAKILEEYAE
ncbi:MAG: hypothetical protein WBN04_14990 [Paracoccaceae bacterium]